MIVEETLPFAPRSHRVGAALVSGGLVPGDFGFDAQRRGERCRMQRTEKTKVGLFAPKPVELEPRITLPAGSYNGTSMRIGVQMSQGTNWTTPQYKIEFDA